jgi:hypothetical protein
VLLVLTAVVVLYAARTIAESKRTTKAAQDTVAALRELTSASRGMAENTRASARETVAALTELTSTSKNAAENTQEYMRATAAALETILTEASQAAEDTSAYTRKTVAALKEILTASKDAAEDTRASAHETAATLRNLLEVSQDTAAVSERHRQLEQLREIGRAVQRIKLEALQVSQVNQYGWWRSVEQNVLRVLLVGVEPPLPKCVALTGESQPSAVATAAQAAEAEWTQVFHDPGASY